MAYTERYANFDLATGLNDGTSEANAWQSLASCAAGYAAGDRVNIKRQSSPESLTALTTFSTSGTALAPVYFRGYETTIGDGGFWASESGTTGLSGLRFSGNYCIVEGFDCNLNAASSNALNDFWVSGNNSWLIKSKIQCRGNARLVNMRHVYWLQDGDDNISWWGATLCPGVIMECFIKALSEGSSPSNQLIIADMFGLELTLINNILVGSGNTGQNGVHLDRVDSNANFNAFGNRLYNFDSGIHIDEEPNIAAETCIISRNVFDTMAAYGVERVNAEQGYVQLLNNFHRNCTSGFSNYESLDETTTDANRVFNTELTADPFVDSSNDDFNINNTAGGGAVLRAENADVDPTA